MSSETFALPASARVGRVALRVGSLDRTVPFYRDVVGLDVERSADAATAEGSAGADGADGPVRSEPTRAVLSAGGTPLVVLVEDPDAPERPRAAAGLFHLAVRVPDRAALGDVFGRARARGALSGASDHLVSEALYLDDPEGNGVEVYRDRPRAEWPRTADGGVRMATDPLDAEGVAAVAAGADALPAGTDVGHVHLEVTDLDRARTFYTATLGMASTTEDYRGAAFVAAGDYHHHVGLNVWHGRTAPAGKYRGLAWVELVVDDATRERLAAHLDARGVAVETTSEGLVFADPDGIEWRVRAE